MGDCDCENCVALREDLNKQENAPDFYSILEEMSTLSDKDLDKVVLLSESNEFKKAFSSPVKRLCTAFTMFKTMKNWVLSAKTQRETYLYQ